MVRFNWSAFLCGGLLKLQRAQLSTDLVLEQQVDVSFVGKFFFNFIAIRKFIINRKIFLFCKTYVNFQKDFYQDCISVKRVSLTDVPKSLPSVSVLDSAMDQHKRQLVDRRKKRKKRGSIAFIENCTYVQVLVNK